MSESTSTDEGRQPRVLVCPDCDQHIFYLYNAYLGANLAVDALIEELVVLERIKSGSATPDDFAPAVSAAEDMIKALVNIRAYATQTITAIAGQDNWHNGAVAKWFLETDDVLHEK